jgi:hypothetical protein
LILLLRSRSGSTILTFFSWGFRRFGFSLARYKRLKIVLVLSGGWAFLFTSEAFGHFLLLPLFPLLFFLAFFECLWASTGHSLFLSSKN